MLPSSGAAFWQQSRDAAQRGEIDTAMLYLKKAFGQGLSDDSLYFLWSEIYIAKGELDTALALNYAAKPDSAGDLARQILEQRYSIFSSLGWKSEARAVLRSLHGPLYRLLRRMVPECAVTFSGGAYLEKNAVDRHYPEPRASDSISSLVSGTGSSVLQAGWLLPLSSSQHLRIGGNVRYGGSRFSGPINPVTGTDSADIAAGAFLRYSAFSGRLGGGYSFSWKRDFLNNSLTVHEVDLSHAIVTDRWLCSIDASFQWEYPVGRNYYYFMVYADREMTPVTSMGFSLVTSGVTEEKLDAQNELEFLYSDGARLYTDSTCSTPIRVKAQLPLFMQSKTTAYCMPMSYVGVNPQLHYEWQMNKKIALGINGGYSVSWYPEKYVWHDERYQSGMQPHLGVTVRDKDGFIALNNRDGRYYWVRSVAALDGVTLDSLPVLFHDERRFDQAVSAGISIRTSWGRWGDVIFDATLRRNFSTLMESAPVDIQRWYANAMMTWFFKFKPSENP